MVDRDRYFKPDEPFPICCVRGCAKALSRGRCAYCSIPTCGIRALSPRRAWEQIELYRTKYGVSSFFEAGDSFIFDSEVDPSLEHQCGHSYPQLLLENRPQGVKISLRIYQNPAGITPEKATVLRDLGVSEVFLGVEHIDDRMRFSSGKLPIASRLGEIFQALQDCQIKIVLALMFGLPGETAESARLNLEFAENAISRFSNIETLFVSVAIPLAGTSLFRELARIPAVVSDYGKSGMSLVEDDVFDYDLLTQLMVRELCSVSASELARVVSQTRQLAPGGRYSSYGDVRLDGGIRGRL